MGSDSSVFTVMKGVDRLIVYIVVARDVVNVAAERVWSAGAEVIMLPFLMNRP